MYNKGTEEERKVPTMKCNINGLPENLTHRYVVCLVGMGLVWYYDSWDDELSAQKQADEVNGFVMEVASCD